jgi:hypothetical protein
VEVWQRRHEIPLARAARIPNSRKKCFYHSNLPSCGPRAKRAGHGRVRLRNIYLATCSLQFAKASSGPANSTILLTVNRHKREVNDFAFGKKSRRGASGGPTGGKRVAPFLVRWHTLPLRGPPRDQRQLFSAGSKISCFLQKFKGGTGED